MARTLDTKKESMKKNNPPNTMAYIKTKGSVANTIKPASKCVIPDSIGQSKSETVPASEE